MSGIKEYRDMSIVRAEQVDEFGKVVSNTGPVGVNAGDYLVYDVTGIYVVSKETFEAHYVAVEGDSEYSPAGKRVEDVVEFMRENPDQVNRIKTLESDGGERKGILEFK